MKMEAEVVKMPSWKLVIKSLFLFGHDGKIDGDKWLFIFVTQRNSVWDAACIQFGDILMKRSET